MWGRGLVAASCLLGLSACQTVTSKPLTVPDVPGGVVYYLPTRLVRLTATRTAAANEDLGDALSKAQSKLADLKKKLAEATAQRKEAEGLLARIDAVAAGRSQQEAVVNIAKASEAVATDAFQAASSAVAVTAAAVLAAPAGAAPCSYEVKVELLPATADPTTALVARPFHNLLRDDTTTLKVSPNGLLSSANVVAVDRTGDILVEIAGAIGAFTIPAGRLRTANEPAPVPTCSGPKSFVEIFDPVSAAAQAGKAVSAKLMKAGFPIALDVRDVEGRTLSIASGSSETQKAAGGVSQTSQGAEGLFYRTAAPVTLVLLQPRTPGERDISKWQQIDASVVLLPQAGKMSFIPLHASAFVKTVDDVAFTDGQISSWSTTRPSELLEIVRLPVRMLTAFIGVPAQILSLKVDYSNKEAGLATAQRAERVAAEKRAALAACLDKANADPVATAACLQ